MWVIELDLVTVKDEMDSVVVWVVENDFILVWWISIDWVFV